MRRRLALTGALVCSCLCSGTEAQVAARPRIFGCVLPASKSGFFLKRSTEARVFATGQEEIIPKSGDPLFDAALARTLAHIANIFDVLPGFAYYEDDESHNAYATHVPRLVNADGTVLFGTNLLKALLSGKESPDVAVTAICAHEFGHILQMKHGLDKRFAGDPTVKRTELQADFLAGYYAGLRKRSDPDYPAAVFAVTQFNMGDDRISFEGHHGRPAERADAVSRGFAVAYQDRLRAAEAIEASTRYAMALK